MAKATICVYRNNNAYSRAYRKYYGRVRQSTLIDSEALCEHVALDSGIERTQVAIIFDAIAKQMKDQLCNGHPIKVDGIGTFKVGISSEGWDLEKVKKLNPRFDPEKEDIRKYLSARQVKEAYLLFTPSEDLRTMLRGVKLSTDKTEWADVIRQEKEAEAEGDEGDENGQENNNG